MNVNTGLHKHTMQQWFVIGEKVKIRRDYDAKHYEFRLNKANRKAAECEMKVLHSNTVSNV